MNTKAIKKQKIVGLKELRENMEEYIQAVENGQRVTVVRRSKPIFTLISPDDDESQWETVIDFTEGGTKSGVDMREVLVTLKKMDG
ncbi:MAG: prevent-host-death family protein [Acidimicrobiales bacterium]|jgi:prevent-host-death family protein